VTVTVVDTGYSTEAVTVCVEVMVTGGKVVVDSLDPEPTGAKYTARDAPPTMMTIPATSTPASAETPGLLCVAFLSRLSFDDVLISLIRIRAFQS